MTSCILCVSLTVCRDNWDVVVCDPPAFAPNKAAVENAKEAYKKLFAASARVRTRNITDTVVYRGPWLVVTVRYI